MLTVLHDLLDTAVNADVSDITIKADAPVSLRINGEMNETDFVPSAALLDEFIHQIAPAAEQHELLKKTGDLDLSHYEDNVGRFRVNVHRQRGAIAINLRWVKNQIKTFAELGLSDVLGKITEAPRGIIFITGTTGSGKSTTLAAMLEYLNEREAKHIITIEDPIEYEFADRKCVFEQREVGIDTESFSSALIHALRQNPDVIMVGEMRDRVSFEAALQASDTGHLVLTTLHATNAGQTMNRILNFYPKDEQDQIRESLAENLVAIISQRLLPRLSGGRVPAFEIMINTPIVNKLIMENRFEKLEAAISGGRAEGMCSFNQCLLDLVNNGEVSEEDALQASDNPAALRMNFEGIFLSATDNQIIG